MLLVVESRQHFFRRVSMPGFEETVGMADGKAWRVRTPATRSYRIQEALWAVMAADHLDLPPQATVIKTWHDKRHGGGVDCVRFAPTHLEWQQGRAAQARVTAIGHDPEMHVDLCFDASGMLVVADYAEPLPRFEFEGAVNLGSKVIPKICRCFEANDLVAEVEVTELAAEGAGAAGSFPRNAVIWSACQDPTPPVLLCDSGIEPCAAAKARRQKGLIVVAAEIGTDGVLHDIDPVKPRSAVLNAHLMIAVRKWLYQPARCGDEPVPVPVTFGVVYPP